MTEYLTEQEQVELLKGWIKQYSLVILAGLALAIGAMTGFRYFQERQNKFLLQASANYDLMLAHRAQGDLKNTANDANILTNKYAKTSYGQLAEFMLARQAVVDKNFPRAEKYLNTIIDKSNEPSLRQIARIRLARILLADNKPNEAINILSHEDDKKFSGLTHEVMADAYVAMNNTTLAKQYYQQALTELPNAESIRPILQMKLDNIGTK